METINALSGELGQRLTWTLLHFLWQGAMLAGLLETAVYLLGVRAMAARYRMTLATLMLMAACPAVTFCLARPDLVPTLNLQPRSHAPRGNALTAAPRPRNSAWTQSVPAARSHAERGNEAQLGTPPLAPLAAPVVIQAAPSPPPQVSALARWQPYLLSGWAIGASLFGLRLLVGGGMAWRMRRGRLPLDQAWTDRARRLAARMGLARARVFVSGRVRQALVMGLWRPMVLLPAAWLAEMPPDMLEGVLAHELAHLRRLDLWAILLQRLVETLLFYHPAVWWLSCRLSREREMCCDEMAVAAIGDRLAFTKALQWAVQQPAAGVGPVLGAAWKGSRKMVLQRIRRLLGAENPRERFSWWPLGLAALVVPALMLSAILAKDPSPTAHATGDGTPTLAEKPLFQDVIVIGNDTYKTSVLKHEAGVKAGDAADPIAVENGGQKIEKYYRDHGYSKVRVTLLEGNKTGDMRVVYMVDEGPRQKVFWVNFVGNTFVSAARLRKIIDAHPPSSSLTAEFNPKQVDEDVNKLIAYYRSFGFFHVTIGREVESNEKQNTVTITFVINEGPRYSIRNITFLGNRKLDNARLAGICKLAAGQYFDQHQQTLDLQKLRDEYGAVGYVFAKFGFENGLLNEPGKMDIVYNIEEGERYHVRRINIETKGDNPHSQITTVLNRLSIKPGDIVDTREIRASERRLKAATLQHLKPVGGLDSKVSYALPDSDGSTVADRREAKYYRYGDGPLPPLPPRERYLDLDVDVGPPPAPNPSSPEPKVPSQPSTAAPQVKIGGKMSGMGVNSDAGLVGEVNIDPELSDLPRLPVSDDGASTGSNANICQKAATPAQPRPQPGGATQPPRLATGVPVAYDNPVSIPIANCELVWQGVRDVVAKNFRIERVQPAMPIGNTFLEGRIDTVPVPGATFFLEPSYHVSADEHERPARMLQSTRRYAVVKVIPAQNGGFWVDVAVFKELENVKKPESATAGSATSRTDASIAPAHPTTPQESAAANQQWIPQGRDTAAEQRMIGQILDRFTPKGENYRVEPPDVLHVEVTQFPGRKTVVEGQYVVRPDGTINLRDCGAPHVAGLTEREAEQRVVEAVSHPVKGRASGEYTARVQVASWNSKVVCVVIPVKDDDDCVAEVPANRSTTVASAILQVEGAAARAAKELVWLVRAKRKADSDGIWRDVKQIDWPAIVQRGSVEANLPLQPGDEIFIGPRPWDGRGKAAPPGNPSSALTLPAGEPPHR